MARFDSPLSKDNAHKSAEIHNKFKTTLLRILSKAQSPIDLATIGFRANVTPSRLTGAMSELIDKKQVHAKKIYNADKKKEVRVYSLHPQSSTSTSTAQ